MFNIIIPTHERPALLSRTLKSLIAQTFTRFQVIVVDDAATYIPPYEDLAALKGRYTYIIRSGESGPAESRNMALALADSRYVMFLDDDDTIDPSHLQSLADLIKETSPAILFCDFKVQHEDRTKTPPTKLTTDLVSIADVTRESVYVRNRIPNSCLAYRKDVLASIRHDTLMEIYEDWDFLLACMKDHDLMHVPINSVTIHKSQATAPANMRRGNTRDDLIAQVMRMLYQRHPARNGETRHARQELMASAGISVDLGDC
jgi:glycosyltransferase involved in cell wall biosynthesis